MAAGHILIISKHPLFAKALARLAQEVGCEVVGTVADVQDALPFLQSHEPEIIIVDHAAAEPRGTDWLPLLQESDGTRRIILLTLAGNEMIIHERRKVTRVTEVELRQALTSSTSLGGGP